MGCKYDGLVCPICKHGHVTITKHKVKHEDGYTSEVPGIGPYEVPGCMKAQVNGVCDLCRATISVNAFRKDGDYPGDADAGKVDG